MGRIPLIAPTAVALGVAGLLWPFLLIFAQRAQRHARQIITAGTKGQEVVDDGTAQHSLFTGTLLDGLRGRADLNGDGYVTVSELMDFLQVCASTLQQTPRLGYFSGQDGGENPDRLHCTCVTRQYGNGGREVSLCSH